MAASSFKRSLFSSNPDRYNDFLVGNDPFIPSDFESIATAVGTGSSGTITFSSIPSTYKHLQIRFLGLQNQFGGQGVRMRLNSDTGTNYVRHNLLGSGGAVVATGATTQDHIPVCARSGGLPTSTTIGGVSIIDVHDYASTTKNKTVRVFDGFDNNTASGEIDLTSGLWLNTNAVTSVTLFMDSANWTTASLFSLYGIKG